MPDGLDARGRAASDRDEPLTHSRALVGITAMHPVGGEGMLQVELATAHPSESEYVAPAQTGRDP